MPIATLLLVRLGGLGARTDFTYLAAGRPFLLVLEHDVD